MAYLLKEVTLRTDNSLEGMARIELLWMDITSGKLPLLFDSDHVFQPGLSPVSRYSHYESDETGFYDLSVITVKADFFQHMETQVAQGVYRKYEAAGPEISVCAQRAWDEVWEQQKSGVIRRAFTCDYESTVPASYAKDGQAHCYLYIALER